MTTTTQNTAPAAEPLFCKDCKYFNDRAYKDPAVCTAPAARKIDLVNGYQSPQCFSERKDLGSVCGPAGELFEPAQSTATQAQLDEWAHKKLFTKGEVIDRQPRDYSSEAPIASETWPIESDIPPSAGAIR